MFRVGDIVFCAVKIAIIVLVLVPTAAKATTIYSNSATGNDSTGDGSPSSPYQTFHKAYTAASSGDTINLAGTFTWSDASETGDVQYHGYQLSKNLTIQGQSATSTFIQSDTSSTTADRRVFTIKNGYTVTIADVTVRNGRNATDYSGTNGGGIRVESGATLAVEDCRITDNYVSSTSWGGYGGGINNEGALTVNRCTIDNNFAYSQGGGVNNAYQSGGGNTAIITNSTIAFNSTAATVATVGGAGIYLRSGTVTVTNSTITYNDAPSGTGDTTGIDVVSGATLNIKNSIVADNEVGGSDVSDSSGNWFDITNSGTFNDNGGNIFGKVNTAYNGVSFHSTSWYDLYGNGIGDDVYRLSSDAGTTGSLYLATTLAANSSNNGTQSFAITNASSVAINNGQSGSNGAVSTPGTDQRLFYRSGDTDIGAYEYNGSATDSVAPTVSLTSPSASSTVSGASVSIAASATDNDAVAGVTFYVDDVQEGSEDTSSSYGITWNSTGSVNGSHTAFAVARDSSGNYATSSSVTFVVDNSGPGISSVSTSTASSSVTITWTTNESGSSKVNYGLTSDLGNSTTETDTGPRVTSHSVTISSLKPCTRYYYNVYSQDAASNSATSTTDTFRTTGCTGDASVSATAQGTITTAAGGTVSQGDLTLTVPTSFTSTSSSAVFQAHQLDADTFFATAGTPSGKSRIGSNIFRLSALTSATTTLSVFSSAVTVTLSYTDAEVSGYEESTLTIYRYDGTAWNSLSGCTVDTAANTVSCTTTSFSDFGVFGDPVTTSSDDSGSVAGGCYKCVTTANNISVDPVNDQGSLLALLIKLVAVLEAKVTALSVGTNSDTSVSRVLGKDNDIVSIEVDLWLKDEGEEVRRLQEFLIGSGYHIRPGVTGYFGELTREALEKFQIDNAIYPASGYFGPKTRAYLNAL